MTDAMTRTLSEIETDIRSATDALIEAQRNEGVARAYTTSALNRLNELQREFKAAYKAMTDNAPRDSDWGRERMQQ